MKKSKINVSLQEILTEIEKLKSNISLFTPEIDKIIIKCREEPKLSYRAIANLINKYFNTNFKYHQIHKRYLMLTGRQ